MKNSEMTQGQAKRLAKKQAALAAKRKKAATRGILIAAVIVVIAAIVIAIVCKINKENNKLTLVTNYSDGLTDEGRISGIDSSKLVTTIDPLNFNVNYSDIEATDDDVQTEIDSFLSSYKYYSDDENLTVKDGDSINLDYVGSVDGVEFEGGNTNGNGTTLTIGSGNYIDNFEEQLIGHKPGENVTVNVTFPEPYDNNPDLAGKPAVFECTINSIQVSPELTDEFIAEKLAESDGVHTVDEYRAKIKSDLEKDNLRTSVQEIISDKSSASDIPSSYTKIVRNLHYTNDYSNYNYYNSFYQQYTGSPAYGSFNDYTGMSDDEYADSLDDSVKKSITTQMAYEVIFDKLGLSISADEYTAYCEELGENAEANFGKGYIMMSLINKKVDDALVERAVIVK